MERDSICVQLHLKSYGCEIDLTTAECPVAPRGPKGCTFVTVFAAMEAVQSLHSWIRRLCEHHTVPAEVCVGHEPPRTTSYGREIDRTTARHPK